MDVFEFPINKSKCFIDQFLVVAIDHTMTGILIRSINTTESSKNDRANEKTLVEDVIERIPAAPTAHDVLCGRGVSLLMAYFDASQYSSSFTKST